MSYQRAVQAGQEVAGSQSEARRQHARIPVGVDDRDVGRVAAGARRFEHVDKREHAFRRVEFAQPRQPRRRLGNPGKTGTRQQGAIEIRHLDGRAPARLVALQVGLRQQAAALAREHEQLRGDRTGVDGRLFLRDRLQRSDEARLVQTVTGL